MLFRSAYAQIMKNKNGRASAGYSGAGGGYRPYGGAHVYRERSGQYAPPAMGFGGLCLSMLLARLFCGCGYPCC